MPHTCRQFESRATVLQRLEARALRIWKRPTRQAWTSRTTYQRSTLTDRVAEALRRVTVTHRCAECKRWIQVTPSAFRPYATTAELTRTTAAERRALCARPVIFSVWQDAAGSSVQKILPKLPALGFDVRRRQAPEETPAAATSSIPEPSF